MCRLKAEELVEQQQKLAARVSLQDPLRMYTHALTYNCAQADSVCCLQAACTLGHCTHADLPSDIMVCCSSSSRKKQATRVQTGTESNTRMSWVYHASDTKVSLHFIVYPGIYYVLHTFDAVTMTFRRGVPLSPSGWLLLVDADHNRVDLVYRWRRLLTMS